MRKIRWFIPMLFAAFIISSAQADPVDYNINFNPPFVGTPVPTFGAFAYDSTIPMFTRFTVDWNGFIWDLTNAANNPSINGVAPACLGGATGAAASFDLLTVCNTGAPNDWAGSTTSGNNYFFFAYPNGAFVAGQIFIEALGTAPLGQQAVGTYSVSTAVPEPGTFSLVGTALALVGGFAWRRKLNRRGARRRVSEEARVPQLPAVAPHLGIDRRVGPRDLGVLRQWSPPASQGLE